jgi:hypothetical protein
MSWSISKVGRDKEKLKEAVRKEQCQSEETSPHNGVPKRVVDHICAEIDRIRVYDFNGSKYAIRVEGNGSFHEQGSNESMRLDQIHVIE